MFANDFDEFDELTEEQQDLAQDWFDRGYHEGYEDGDEQGAVEATKTAYEEGKATGFKEGLEYERQRIYSILEMQMKWAEQEGKGNEYLRWKNVKEYLTPVDFTPWTDEEWQKELEKDGF